MMDVAYLYYQECITADDKWKIVAVEVKKRTKRMVFFGNWSRYTNYKKALPLDQVFDNWQQAHSALLSHVRSRVSRATAKLEAAQVELRQVEEMKEEAAENGERRV